jgi:RNA ligase (TIGR02306 family)
MSAESNTDSTRKLASIQIIDKIDKHGNADALELAIILGWQVVVRAGEVEIGSKVIYCEIDSLLPVTASWLPPAIKSRIEEHRMTETFRVKTIKLRGELSQGLIVPIIEELKHLQEMEVGTDVTSILGIKKYEPPALTGRYAMYTTNSGESFPTHLLDKTDEPRVQSAPKSLELLHGRAYYMTVKLDGTSSTFLINPETQELTVCSRNLVRKRPENVKQCPYWYIADKYQLESRLQTVPHLAIQGEICGPNIQKNLLKLKDLHLYIFNIVDIRDRRKLSYDEMKQVCQNLNLETVPLEEIGESFSYPTIKSLLEAAKGFYRGTKNPREGLVIRSIDASISFKAINNDYLLKND